MNELLRHLEAHLMHLSAEDRTQFIGLIRPTVGLKETLADDAIIGVGQSKIGGRPDLPASVEWPAFPIWNNEPLAFCVQYNLAEVAPFDLERLLPGKGLLSVFIFIDPNLPGFFKWPESFRIIYTEDVSTLKRTDFPAHYVRDGIFQSAQLSFFQYFTTPINDNYKLEIFNSGPRAAFDIISGAVQEFADSTSGLMQPDLPQFPTHNLHQLLGEERPVQASVLNDFAQDVFTAEFGDEALLQVSRETIEAIKREYIILLQIDTGSSRDNDLNKHGGGCVIYFGIKPEDLRNRRFDRVVMAFQNT